MLFERLAEVCASGIDLWENFSASTIGRRSQIMIFNRYRTAFFPDHQIQSKVCGIVSTPLTIVSVFKLEILKNIFFKNPWFFKKVIEKNGDKNKGVQLDFLRVIDHQILSKNVIHFQCSNCDYCFKTKVRLSLPASWGPGSHISLPLTH